MRHLVHEAGLSHVIEIESAGTAAYHTGSLADHRARQAAARRGIRLEGRARQFQPSDWERFDYVLAMDASNEDDLEATLRGGSHGGKLRLLRSFDPSAQRGAGVPDPYYGGPEGFDEVLDLCEAACKELLAHLRREHGI
jgi:protein-tyrosine phosphatase